MVDITLLSFLEFRLPLAHAEASETVKLKMERLQIKRKSDLRKKVGEDLYQ